MPMTLSSVAANKQNFPSWYALTLHYNTMTFRFQLYIRIIFSCLEVATGCVFLCYLRSAGHQSVKTRTVKITLWFELVFDALPAWGVFFDKAWILVFGWQLAYANYFNSQSAVMGSMGAVCVSFFYTWVWFKRFHQKEPERPGAGARVTAQTQERTVSNNWVGDAAD